MLLASAETAEPPVDISAFTSVRTRAILADHLRSHC